jgi:FkbM family methyltransferase
MRGQDLLIQPDVNVSIRQIGVGYGTWSVVPSLITPGDLAFCFGLGTDILLESTLAAEYGVTVFGFDPTPAALQWIATQVIDDRLVVVPYGLAAFDGVLRFAAPINSGGVSLSAIREVSGDCFIELQVRTLNTLRKTYCDGREVALLKMDIEGSEYEVLESLVNEDQLPPQLLVEFHHRFAEAGVAKTRRAIDTLRTAGYLVAHVSPNGEEFTFVHKTALHRCRV